MALRGEKTTPSAIPAVVDMTLMDPGQESPPGPPSVCVPSTCFVPVLRSGFCSDQGSRQTMEDAHVAIDNLSHIATGRALCHPQGFYGVSNCSCPKQPPGLE